MTPTVEAGSGPARHRGMTPGIGQPAPSYRWVVMAILGGARIAMGYQFQAVGSVAPFLVDTFAIDYATIGTLIGFYLLPGIVLALPAG